MTHCIVHGRKDKEQALSIVIGKQKQMFCNVLNKKIDLMTYVHKKKKESEFKVQINADVDENRIKNKDD